MDFPWQWRGEGRGEGRRWKRKMTGEMGVKERKEKVDGTVSSVNVEKGFKKRREGKGRKRKNTENEKGRKKKKTGKVDVRVFQCERRKMV